MKTLLCIAVLLPVASMYSTPPAEKPRSAPELAIVAVTVDLEMSVRVTDAHTGAPIPGATVTLVRSGDGKELAPLEVQNSHQADTTNRRGMAHLNAAFGGNACTFGWVEAYTGNSFVSVSAPNYAGSRAWISTPSGRLAIDDVRNGKVAIQPLDTLRFEGKEARRKVSYHVVLHRDTDA